MAAFATYLMATFRGSFSGKTWVEDTSKETIILSTEDKDLPPSFNRGSRSLIAWVQKSTSVRANMQYNSMVKLRNTLLSDNASSHRVHISSQLGTNKLFLDKTRIEALHRGGYKAVRVPFNQHPEPVSGSGQICDGE
ncbi:hypothetical protein F5146DRAFT_1002247 [Armillaria mellea]|nr:hypothetical protein F5146DRAFT_1002247 [Armillaria mellea]